MFKLVLNYQMIYFVIIRPNYLAEYRCQSNSPGGLPIIRALLTKQIKTLFFSLQATNTVSVREYLCVYIYLMISCYKAKYLYTLRFLFNFLQT